MGWVECKSVRFILPAFTDEFICGKSSEGFEPTGEVVSGNEVVEVNSELFPAVIVVALDGGFLDGPVHAFDLSVGPGMVGLGEAVFDSVNMAGAVEGMAAPSGRESSTVLWQIGELDAVVGQHCVDAIRNRGNHLFQKGCGSAHVGAFDQLHERELGSAVDGHEEIELAFRGAHLGQIDVEIADRIALELYPPGLVSFHLGQTADAMPFLTPMKGRTGQLRDRGPARRRGSRRAEAACACGRPR